MYALLKILRWLLLGAMLLALGVGYSSGSDDDAFFLLMMAFSYVMLLPGPEYFYVSSPRGRGERASRAVRSGQWFRPTAIQIAYVAALTAAYVAVLLAYFWDMSRRQMLTIAAPLMALSLALAIPMIRQWYKRNKSYVPPEASVAPTMPVDPLPLPPDDPI